MQKLGAAIYGRKEGAKRWLYRNRNNRRPFYYNHIAISPFSDKETYHYNISFDRTTDGGKTFVAAGRGGGGGGGGGGGRGGGGGAGPGGRGARGRPRHPPAPPPQKRSPVPAPACPPGNPRASGRDPPAQDPNGE